MYIHPVLRAAAFLAGVAVTLKRLVALFVPIGTIVAICTALPAMMLWASPFCPIALEAAKVVFSVCSGLAGEWLSAVFTGKSGFLANMQAALFGNTFALAGFRTKAMRAFSPAQEVWLSEWLATIVAVTGDWLEVLACSVRAGARAICAYALGAITEDFATDRADVLNPGNIFRHFYTSDSVVREMGRGTFLGKNARRQVISLPKPLRKYNTLQACCQGVFYARN